MDTKVKTDESMALWRDGAAELGPMVVALRRDIHSFP